MRVYLEPHETITVLASDVVQLYSVSESVSYKLIPAMAKQQLH